MSAFAPIILADGAATPVARTFSPVNIDSAGVAKLAERSSGISVGFPVLTLSIRNPSKTSRNYRVVAKIVSPVLEVTSASTGTGIQPAPTKAYDLIGTIEFVLPERSTLLDRKHILAFVKNLCSDASVVNAVQSFEAIY